MEYNIIASMAESTVCTEYVRETRSPYGTYQSEAALEADFIRILTEEGYEYLEIHDADALKCNLRRQIEKLNDYEFTDDEWQRFFNTSIANANDGIKEKTRRIQEDYIQNLRRDDGSTKNIMLINKTDIHKNFLQVISIARGGR